MPLRLFAGRIDGRFVTVACPSWDGECRCPREPEEHIPDHLVHEWPAAQDEATNLREARLLAEEHVAVLTRRKRPFGDLSGLRQVEGA